MFGRRRVAKFKYGRDIGGVFAGRVLRGIEIGREMVGF
jgi:hypothetical protein